MHGQNNCRQEFILSPLDQTLLGTHVNGKANFMALDWLTRVNYQPAMLGGRGRAGRKCLDGWSSVSKDNESMIGRLFRGDEAVYFLKSAFSFNILIVRSIIAKKHIFPLTLR